MADETQAPTSTPDTSIADRLKSAFALLTPQPAPPIPGTENLSPQVLGERMRQWEDVLRTIGQNEALSNALITLGARTMGGLVPRGQTPFSVFTSAVADATNAYDATRDWVRRNALAALEFGQRVRESQVRAAATAENIAASQAARAGGAAAGAT